MDSLRVSSSTSSQADPFEGMSPAQENGWAFAKDKFFRKATDGSSHERADITTILALNVAPKPLIETPFWCEAQLRHYGRWDDFLETKGAKVRQYLHNAARARTLRVPEDVKAIEAKLRVRWHAQQFQQAQKVQQVQQVQQAQTAQPLQQQQQQQQQQYQQPSPPQKSQQQAAEELQLIKKCQEWHRHHHHLGSQAQQTQQFEAWERYLLCVKLYQQQMQSREHYLRERLEWMAQQMAQNEKRMAAYVEELQRVAQGTQPAHPVPEPTTPSPPRQVNDIKNDGCATLPAPESTCSREKLANEKLTAGLKDYLRSLGLYDREAKMGGEVPRDKGKGKEYATDEPGQTRSREREAMEDEDEPRSNVTAVAMYMRRRPEREDGSGPSGTSSWRRR